MAEVSLFERLNEKIVGHSYFDIMLYNDIVSTYEDDKKKKPDEMKQELEAYGKEQDRMFLELF